MRSNKTRQRQGKRRRKHRRTRRRMRGGDYATPTTKEFQGFSYPSKKGRDLYVVYPGGFNTVDEYVNTLDTQGYLQDYQ